MRLSLNAMAGPEARSSNAKSIEAFSAAVIAEREASNDATDPEPVNKSSSQTENDSDRFTRATERAVLRYMLAARDDVPNTAVGDESETPVHVAKAHKYIAILRKLDPKSARVVERFYLK